MTPPPTTASVVVEHPSDGRVLAVSRGRGSSEWGLPGGHLEKSERFDQAAQRELLEETGILATRLRPIMRAFTPKDKLTTVYLAQKTVGMPLTHSPEGDVASKSWEELCGQPAPWGAWHTKVRNAFLAAKADGEDLRRPVRRRVS